MSNKVAIVLGATLTTLSLSLLTAQADNHTSPFAAKAMIGAEDKAKEVGNFSAGGLCEVHENRCVPKHYVCEMQKDQCVAKFAEKKSADAKCGDGKCGDCHDKTTDAKCGDGKCGG